MWIGLGQYITIAILIERMLQRITMRRQLNVSRYIRAWTTLFARGPRIGAWKFPLLSIVFSERCCNVEWKYKNL